MNSDLYLEKNISQQPAIDLLTAMGYTYISPADCDKQRGSRYHVLLRDILRGQLRRLNRYVYAGAENEFSAANIERAMEDIEGISRACCIFDEKKSKLYGFYVGEIEKKELHHRMSSSLPPFMVPVIKLNPLYHYINCMRCLVMYGTVPGPNTWFACIVCAVGMMVVGLAAFRKLQRNFILYL